MGGSLRTRLVLAIGIPFLLVYGAMSWLLAVRWREDDKVRLELAAIERIAVLAGRIDDRVRLAGLEAVSADGLADLDRQADVSELKPRFVIVDREGRVVHDSAKTFVPGTDLQSLVDDRLKIDVQHALHAVTQGSRGLLLVEGLFANDARWLAYAPIPAFGGAVFAAAPESAVLAGTEAQIRLALGLLGVGLIVLLAIVWWMSSYITRPVSKLATAVTTLGRGDLSARVEGVTTRDEIGALAGAFNTMVDDLGRHVDALEKATAAREKLESELAAARTIQNALLPKSLPTGADFRCAAKNLPARHVAGDFYDAFEDRGAIVLVVADVSGKGLASALYMAVAKTMLQRALLASPSLTAAVSDANDALERESIGSMYLTAFVARFDPSTGRLQWLNAGHPEPWRLGTGAPTPLGASTGGPVGMFPRRKFEERETVLAAGERLVVFTDGVPEAQDAGGEFYGDERLAALLASSPPENAEATCARLADTIWKFQAGELADDLTVMVLERA